MKRVLVVYHRGLEKAGVQTVIMEIVRSLHDEYIFDLYVYLPNEDDYYEEEFLGFGGSIFRDMAYQKASKLYKKIDPYIRGNRIRRNLNEILKKNKYDVIHCHNHCESGLFLQVAYKNKIPVRICHAHELVGGGNAVYKLYCRYYKKLILKYATSLLGCSRLVCEKIYGDKNGTVVNNPYDEIRFDSSKYKVCKKNVLTLIQVGHLDDNKNQLYTVKILHEIIQINPETKLFLVAHYSDKQYEEKLHEYIIANGLENSVIFYKDNPNVAEILAMADYFIFPSKKEGFGIVLIEAQAMGLKCFVSDTVPKNTQAGGCKYVSIEMSPAYWADLILQEYKNGEEKIPYDCSNFKRENFANIIRGVYEER